MSPSAFLLSLMKSALYMPSPPMSGIWTLSLSCWLRGAPHGVLAAVVDGLGAGALDLGDDGVEVTVVGVDVVGADDLAAELRERRLEGGGEAYP